MSIYRQLLPEDKIQVFISSMCGDECPVGKLSSADRNYTRKNYVLVRRELEALLESTGLFKVYNFDTGNASSVSTREEYLSSLDRSDLVVFLVDNLDGISQGVQIEEKRARSNPDRIKRLYIFCHEYSSKKTIFQTTLEANPDTEPRFYSVSEFIQLGEKAFQSIMADVIKHYILADDVQRKQADIIAQTRLAAESVNPLSTDEHTRITSASILINDCYESECAKERSGKTGVKYIDAKKNVDKEETTTDTTPHPTNIQYEESSKTAFALDKKLYKAPKLLGEYLTDVMLTGKSGRTDKVLSEEDRESPIESLSVRALSNLIGKASFNSNAFDDLMVWVVDHQSTILKSVVTERLNSIKSAFLGDLDSALMHERKAFEIACSISVIPYWILNDIAIDIRNIISMKAKAAGNIQLDNEGQMLIDKSIEYVHYPLLDRAVANFEKNVIDKYEKDYRQSPYTITIGSGLDAVFEEISKTFWIALLNGSYTQIEITKHRLITALNMISNIYDDHKPVVELIRLILIQNENINDNIDALLRTYHGDSDLLDPEEAASIYQSIEWMPIKIRREQSEYYFFAKFSCYCSDKFFAENVGRIIDRTNEWAESSNRGYWNNEDKYRFYDGLNSRGLPDKWIDFAIKLFRNTPFSTTLYPLRRDICQHIRNLDYSEISGLLIDKLLNFLIPLDGALISEEDQNPSQNTGEIRAAKTLDQIDADEKTENSKDILGFHDNPYLMDVVIQICLLQPDFKTRVIDGVKGAPIEERNRLTLELEVNGYKSNKDIELYKCIKRYLEAAESHAKATENGTYAEGAVFYVVIRNIIENSKVVLTKNQIEEIADYGFKFLGFEHESINQKVACCQVLSILLTNYKDDFDNNKLYTELLNNKDKYSAVEADRFLNDSSIQLRCAYLLMLIAGGYKGNDELIDVLYSIGNDQEYVKIQCLDILTQALRIDSKNKFTKSILNTICNFVLLVSNSHERDTKYYSVLCLVELTRYSSTSNTALRRLMVFMDGSNAQIRWATVARVRKSRFKDNPYVEAIMAKAKVDHHYMVRKMAAE